MITHLTLTNFKGFESASIPLGPFTVIAGANATGKSNIGEALRFLQGVGRGYSLPDTFGEGYVEGNRVWPGLRGGVREAVFGGASLLRLQVDAAWPRDARHAVEVQYAIEVDTQDGAGPPVVVSERLAVADDTGTRGYTAPVAMWTDGVGAPLRTPDTIAAELDRTTPNTYIAELFECSRPILAQVPERASASAEPEQLDPGEGSEEDREVVRRLRLERLARVHRVSALATWAAASLRQLRFLNLSLDAMRKPSQPGQTVLGDRGENLSSVLQAICANPEGKRDLLDWLGELTPMDVADLKFPSDLQGRVLAVLVEASGQEISAHSASDGTLRFLAILAALLGPETGGLYFIEELENGIHPARLWLLLELCERRARSHGTQIIATTHSPQLLGYLSQEALGDALLTYRLPDSPSAQVMRIVDIPHAREVIEKQRVDLLHASGWFEDVLYLEGDEPEPAEEPVGGVAPA